MTREKDVLLVWLTWSEKCFSIQKADVAYLKELVGARAELVVVKTERAFLRELPRAAKVITWTFKEEWHNRAPHLKWVATPSAGHELIAQLPFNRIKVHFGHYHGAIMSESVAAFMLAWARGFFRPERADFWPRVALSDKCYLVAGTKAVIIGYGVVGRGVGEKLANLGVSVQGFHRANMKDLPAALREADWVICALPSDTGTDNLVNAKLLRQLPRRAVLINIGRGNAVDEKALLAALRSGRLAGAYLDVFRGEPSPFSKEKPVIYGEEYKHLPWNLIRMPHASAFSGDYIRRAFKELKDDRLI